MGNVFKVAVNYYTYAVSVLLTLVMFEYISNAYLYYQFIHTLSFDLYLTNSNSFFETMFLIYFYTQL